MSETNPIQEGQILEGPLFNEPMRVEIVRSGGPGVWVAGLVGAHTGAPATRWWTALFGDRYGPSFTSTSDGGGESSRLGFTESRVYCFTLIQDESLGKKKADCD